MPPSPHPPTRWRASSKLHGLGMAECGVRQLWQAVDGQNTALPWPVWTPKIIKSVRLKTKSGYWYVLVGVSDPCPDNRTETNRNQQKKARPCTPQCEAKIQNILGMDCLE